MGVALVTGITGQTGYYVAREFLNNNHKVVGMVRYSASSYKKFDERIDVVSHPNMIIESGNLEDQASLDNLVKQYKPDYFVNCGAMSHVGQSWKIPEATAQITGVGVLRCLESIRKNRPECFFAQCSTSEMFGNIENGSADENTPLYARSPYGAAKIFGHQMVKVYRDSYDIKSSSVIMFNHESRLRDITFFTRKITNTMRKIYDGDVDKIELGNLNFCRDWGYAGDYARAIYMISTGGLSDDFVVSTGETHTGWDFVEEAFSCANRKLESLGSTFRFDKEKHIDTETKKYIRPNDLVYLKGNSTKIKTLLGWEPKIGFGYLVEKMVDYDLFKK